MRSFDVFDTVLTRRLADPRDVFVLLGAELHMAGEIACEPEAFARARQTAQDRAASVAPAGEATLAEIYAALAPLLGWAPGQLAGLVTREIELESRLVTGVPARRKEIAAAHAAGEDVVFLSDTQLPSSAICSWLEREGLWHPGDRLYVSCEARAGKRDGGLFRIALRECGGAPGTWLHVGDTPAADVHAPRRLGLRSREEPEARLSVRERRLHPLTEPRALWRSTLAAAARLARLDCPVVDPRARIVWETSATVAGPLFVTFTRWLLDEAARRGVRSLYFVARGGQIFLRIAEELQRDSPRPIECRYLHLSRRAIAGIGEYRTNRLRDVVMAPGESVHTLARIYVNLDLPAAWPPPPGFTRDDLQRNLSAKERASVADWLFGGDRRSAVEAIVGRRADAALAYLEREGVAPGRPIAFVDTGWAGTLQRALEDCLGRPEQPSPFTWFYLGLRDHPTPTVGPALGFSNTFRHLPLTREPWLATLLELFARADHGTLARYRPAPVLEPPESGDVVEANLTQAAVLAFTRHYVAGVDVPRPPLATLARTVIDHFAEFASHPSHQEAGTWGKIAHKVHPADQGTSVLSPDFGPRDVLRRLLRQAERPPAWWLPGQGALGSRALTGPWLWLRRWRR